MYLENEAEILNPKQAFGDHGAAKLKAEFEWNTAICWF